MKKFILLGLLLVTTAFSAQDYYPFNSVEKQQRFDRLTTQLRCLVCQNQNIAESNAPLAADLRKQIYQKIQQGQTEADIANYLVNRYGDYVLYRPPFNALTLGLWLGPFLLLIGSIGYLFYYLRTVRVKN